MHLKKKQEADIILDPMAVPSLSMEKEAQPSTTTVSKPYKIRGPLGILLASLFMSRDRRTRKTTHEIEKQSGRDWKNLICGIRPLHNLEQGPLTPPPMSLSLRAADKFHDVPLPPPSPARSCISSRYASAENLPALDKSDWEDDNNFDDNDQHKRPNSIDMQAEEFIAKFYEQMKLQRLESMEMERD